ncbi:MAG: YraN family protein [Firmicutes bacterium]|nr:YraN family protein [Bacillota bacterium]
MNTKPVGVSGELKAKEYLIKQGYKIIATNYTTKLGEIDIIAEDGDTIVFVEVKARYSVQYGLPREAVTPYKQNKVRTVATYYLRANNLFNRKVRCDVIEILYDKLHHFKNAF